MPSAYRTFDVAVAGGSLRVAQWGAAGPLVLCAHGITANHTTFHWLADRLAGHCRLVAPDLRGRGRSNAITGPFGMGAHAADLMAVLDHLGAKQADLVLGQSMGGFIAAVAAAQHPERVARVLMVDGGIPLMDVAFITRLPFADWIIERIATKILGPSMKRLDMTFASREAYRAFWRPHPALASDWSGYAEEYFDYDLDGNPPSLRSSTNKTALMRDVRTELIEPLVRESLRKMRCPVRFLRAPRGVMNDKALYDEGKLARNAAGIPQFSVATVPDVNHFTILLSERGAKAVANEVRALLA